MTSIFWIRIFISNAKCWIQKAFPPIQQVVAFGEENIAKRKAKPFSNKVTKHLQQIIDVTLCIGYIYKMDCMLKDLVRKSKTKIDYGYNQPTKQTNKKIPLIVIPQ